MGKRVMWWFVPMLSLLVACGGLRASTPQQREAEEKAGMAHPVRERPGEIYDDLEVLRVLRQLTPQTVEVGQEATFSIEATRRVRAYKWTRDGRLLSACTTATCTLRASETAQSGTFKIRVEVMSRRSTVTSETTLTVKAAGDAGGTDGDGTPPKPPVDSRPHFKINLNDQTAQVGSSVTFKVEPDGAGPYLYHWYHNDEPIVHCTSETRPSNTTGDDGRSCTINKVQESDAGKYAVELIRADGKGQRSSNFVKLTVTKETTPPSGTAPSFKTDLPAEQTVQVGSSVDLKVEPAGSAPFTYHWYKDGNLITRCTTATCTLSNVQSADAGRYAVELINAYGQKSSDPLVLSVNSPDGGNKPPNGPLLKAKSCQAADVQAALDQAKPGTTVQIPAGRCDWGAAQVKAQAGIILRGAGPKATVLHRSAEVGDSNHYMLTFTCSAGKTVEVSAIGFLGNNDTIGDDYDNGLRLDGGCIDFKVHDMLFEKFSHTALRIDTPNGQQRGVIYNSEFNYNFLVGLGYGVAVTGDGKTWGPLELGNQNAVFIEDSTFTGNRHGITSNYGSRYVARHNKFFQTQESRNWSPVDAHGLQLQDGGNMGSRSFEIYNNTFDVVPGMSDLASNIGIRGGDGVIFGNRYSKNYPYAFSVVNETCGGAYPMKYQPREVYTWDNRGWQAVRNTQRSGTDTWGGGVAIVESCAHLVQKGRDYFVDQTRSGYKPYTYPHPLRSK